MNLSFEEIVPRTPPLIELLVRLTEHSVVGTIKKIIFTYHHLIDKLINGFF